MEANGSEAVDFVDFGDNDSLLVEFAKTGIDKHFRKIYIGAVERSQAQNFVTSIYIEADARAHFSLVFEAQEVDYAGKPKLRRCVIEQFETETAATRRRSNGSSHAYKSNLMS